MPPVKRRPVALKKKRNKKARKRDYAKEYRQRQAREQAKHQTRDYAAEYERRKKRAAASGKGRDYAAEYQRRKTRAAKVKAPKKTKRRAPIRKVDREKAVELSRSEVASHLRLGQIAQLSEAVAKLDKRLKRHKANITRLIELWQQGRVREMTPSEFRTFQLVAQKQDYQEAIRQLESKIRDVIKQGKGARLERMVEAFRHMLEREAGKNRFVVLAMSTGLNEHEAFQHWFSPNP